MVRGAINYLYIKYPDCGFKKNPVMPGVLLKVLESEGVDIIEISTKEMATVVDYDIAEKFVAYLSYGEDTIETTKPSLFLNSSAHEGKKWFGIAHEMGHFLMHRFIDSYHSNTPEGDGIKGFRGRLELEADIFANHIFMPDIIIDQKFGKSVRKILVKMGNGTLRKVFQEILTFCLQYCYQTLDLTEKTIHPRGILNLKLRAVRYISNIREELFIMNHDSNNPHSVSFKPNFYFSDKDLFESYLDMK